MGGVRVGAAAVGLVLLLAAPAPGQQRDHQAELDRLRGEIRSLRGRLDSVRRQAGSVQTDLQAIELELGIVTRELEAALETESSLEQQRRSIADRVFEVNRDLQRHKRYLSTRLSMLYRMGRVPYLRMLLSIDPRRNPVEGATMLAYLVGRDARAVSSFQRAQERLVLEEGRLAAKEEEIARTRRIAAERRAAVERKRREKEALLARLRSESRRSAARLAELEEKARRLERLFELLYSRSGASLAGVTIREFKGALDWPVHGTLVEDFGRQRSTEFNTWIVNNGIRIGTEPGREVRAVYAGTVLFAQWFRGYGNLIILDHGDRVFSLYGNTRGSTLQVGERVDAGAVIAVVAEDEEGDSGSLYFEIREDNRPTDPKEWLR